MSVTQPRAPAARPNGAASGAIKPDEINAILWKACDTFRGTIDPSEYKNYILVMLWADRQDELRATYGNDARQIQRQPKYERFVLPEGTDFATLYAGRNESNVGELINVALELIEDANKEKLQGVFRNIDTLLKQQKRGLMQRLLTGQVRVLV